MGRQLETLDDFDDEATDLGKVTPGMSKGHATSLSSSKLSQRVTTQLNKPKVRILKILFMNEINFLFVNLLLTDFKIACSLYMLIVQLF